MGIFKRYNWRYNTTNTLKVLYRNVTNVGAYSIGTGAQHKNLTDSWTYWTNTAKKLQYTKMLQIKNEEYDIYYNNQTHISQGILTLNTSRKPTHLRILTFSTPRKLANLRFWHLAHQVNSHDLWNVAFNTPKMPKSLASYTCKNLTE